MSKKDFKSSKAILDDLYQELKSQNGHSDDPDNDGGSTSDEEEDEDERRSRKRKDKKKHKKSKKKKKHKRSRSSDDNSDEYEEDRDRDRKKEKGFRGRSHLRFRQDVDLITSHRNTMTIGIMVKHLNSHFTLKKSILSDWRSVNQLKNRFRYCLFDRSIAFLGG